MDELLTDPFKFMALCWPDVTIYDKQAEIICSVRDNYETYAPAGNMLGKDFIGGFIMLWFFLSRHPCRVVTTSAKDEHLDVLWGECGRFIQTSKYPLTKDQGGSLIFNHREIRKVICGEVDEFSYLKGMVASDKTIAAMQGHHVDSSDGTPRNLFLCDEASSVSDMYYRMAVGWAKRLLVLGNTWPCSNFFYRAVKGSPDGKDKGGDIPSADLSNFYRRVIQITAEDSPNVRQALMYILQHGGTEQAKREAMKLRPILPGVKSYEEYLRNLAMWDEIQQSVSLRAEFYEGAEIRLFPKPWLDQAAVLGNGYCQRVPLMRRTAKAVGVDPAEGGDKTAMCAVDQYGIVDLRSESTPDTSKIPGMVLGFAREHGCDPENIIFDAGGGGKQHADRMRAQGHKVRMVAFGEAATSADRWKHMRTKGERKEEVEQKMIYKNRRAEMYGISRQLIDPANGTGYGIPSKYTELRRQLMPIPLSYGEDGKMELPPKDKRDKDSNKVTLKELIGCSPDEADAMAMANYAMMHKSIRRVVGSML